MTVSKDNGGLNFRDFEGFNLAMLGKQRWKLITNSFSLLTRVLKAKYFPIIGFLVANIGHNPSYTWRSIQSTIPLLSLGYRWKIGDISNINVWTNPWIRSRTNMHPTTAPPQELYADLRVSHLFDSVRNTWNCALLNTIFNTQDVADICKIPLHTRALQDSIIWKVSPNGNYSVKTAYRLCLNLVLHDSSLRVNDLIFIVAVFNVNLFALSAMVHLKMNCTSLQIVHMLSRVGLRLAHVFTWEKPSANSLKCNVDGAMTEGKFGIVTAAECEATAMKHALTLALSNGFERVIFENDCQQAVNALHNDYLYANELILCS
ncbi:ribonuclease H, partial [Trifolium pratense]